MPINAESIVSKPGTLIIEKSAYLYLTVVYTPLDELDSLCSPLQRQLDELKQKDNRKELERKHVLFSHLFTQLLAVFFDLNWCVSDSSIAYLVEV